MEWIGWIGNVVELVVFDLCHGFLNIVNCYTFARLICGNCLYRLWTDMQWITFPFRDVWHDGFRSYWWSHHELMISTKRHTSRIWQQRCPMSVAFSDKARNYKIPFNKRRRGIPKDAPLTLVYGGYTVEILSGVRFSPGKHWESLSWLWTTHFQSEMT